MATGSTPAPRRILQRILDFLLVHTARLTLRVFFRRIEIVGAENIPTRGPVLVVANHFNGLVDPLLLAFLPVRPRFLAKSTLWSNPAVRPLLAMSSAVPVYRQQDQADTTRNEDSFAECHRRLAEGDAVAIFPEGKSHSESGLAPMKTGAARIVLEAIRQDPGFRIPVVPVGLTFEEKESFRSRVLIQVGEPIDPTADFESFRKDPRRAVRALTERIGAGLADVTLGYPSHADQELIERTADFYLSKNHTDPAGASLQETFQVRRAVAAGYGRLRYREVMEMEGFRSSLDRYESLIAGLKLLDRHVVDPDSAHPILRIAAILLLAPIALVGVVLNYLPYRTAGVIASRVENSPDLPATYKLFTGFFLLPLTWAATAALAALKIGMFSGLATFAFAPVSGWVALRFSEHVTAVWRDVRARMFLRTHAELLDTLRSHRAIAEHHLARLIEAYDAWRNEGDRSDRSA